MNDLFGGLEKSQKEMKDKLKTIELEVSSPDREVVVKINAARDILNIAISDAAFQSGDKEMIEDLLTVTVNEALQKAAEKEAEEASQMIQNMLPPGMGDLSSLFGS